MNRYLKQLIEIAEIDKEIDSFEPRIAEAKFEVNQILKQKDAVMNDIATLEDECKDLSLKINKNDGHLAELNKKLEDITRKWKMVKTEKENKALSLEEEILKEQVTFANEEIERLGKNKTSKEEEISNKQEEINKLGEREEELKTAVQGLLANIYKQRESILQKKEVLTRKMDQKISHFYEKIRKWAKNTSVVPIYKQACGGCFIRLNDKLFTDVLKSEDIITCPHCGRILFIDETLAATSKPSKQLANNEELTRIEATK